MGQSEAQVSRDEAARQAAILFERIGLLHASYARTLVDELGEEEGRRLILKAIKRYGQHVLLLMSHRAAATPPDADRHVMVP